MKVEQISVFLENEAGRLAEVTGCLAAAGVNIRALALADTTDFGVLRLIVNDRDLALGALRERGFVVRRTEVLAVEVPDRPGGLHQILRVLDAEGINVEYMYAFVRQSGDRAVMIFRFESVDRAMALLSENGVTVVAPEKIYGL